MGIHRYITAIKKTYNACQTNESDCPWADENVGVRS